MCLTKKIDLPEFIDEIFRAKNNLYLSLPSIDNLVAEKLINIAGEISIKVLIDNSEDSIRNGFGEIEGINKLIKNKIQIFQSDGNQISFIISDNVGYFLFPQSKIFSEKAKGTNAFKIDPVTIQLLIQHFFPKENQSEEIKLDQFVAIGDSHKYFETAFQEFQKNITTVQKFDNEKYETIVKNLSLNPPLSPNLQRQINTYTAKIQFVELKFSGGNLKDKIVTLPKNAIPINSEELRSLLLTRIKMFQDIEQNPEYKKFQELNDKIEKLRREFLIPITCRTGKSILKVDEKEIFLDELEKLKVESKTVTKELKTLLHEGRLNTLSLLRDELRAFFKENKPKELNTINKPEVREMMLEEIINSIISSVKFPDIRKLIENISLSEHFYDLTWNDFKDENLLKEFKRKEIMLDDEIDSIVKLKDAFEAEQPRKTLTEQQLFS